MDNTKDSILSAALMLVAQKGFHGIVMSEVCREANVPAGVIYRFFSNKKQLIEGLFQEVNTRYHHAIFSGCNEEMEIRDLFRTIWHNTAKYYDDLMPEIRFMDQFFHSSYFSEMEEEAKIIAAAPYVRYLAKGVKEGILRDYPLCTLNAMMMGPLRNLLFTSFCAKHEISTDDIDKTFELCWKSISMV